MQKILAFILLLSSVNLISQEILDQTDHFDFKKLEAEIEIIPSNSEVKGDVAYTFDIISPKDTLFIDGKKMKFSNIQYNGDPIEHYSDENGIYLISKFLPAKDHKLTLNYSVKPDSGMYFINWDDDDDSSNRNRQVWTQGQGKYTSTWLPSFDEITEKLEFDLNFEFPAFYELISNGKLESLEKITDSTRLWKFDMTKPMSSYLVAVAAGNYIHQTVNSASGDEIQLYYLVSDSLLYEPTYRHTQEIFDFLEKEIGVAYPWQNYKQVPVQDFLYGGMENTGTTIFSESFLTDFIGFKDRNYVNVNAHELAHQWFGNLVTENGKHHWLHEGFATYYALLAEKEIFGEDYYYWKLYETAEKLKELSDSGKGKSLLSPDAGSLTFYQKGAWALHILRERIGDEAFRSGMKNYLELYSFKNVETDNFIAEMETASGMDLSGFMADWLKQSAFKATQSLESLKKSEFITSYLNMASLRETSLEQKFDYLNKNLGFPVNDYIGQEVVHQLAGKQSDLAIRLYKKAFETNNMYVRQAIATSIQEIPPALKKDFESLLKDESYLTIEAALFKLWEQFPKDRANYLEQTRDLDGFYNKNIRMLWLTLNLVTPEFEADLTEDYYNELAGYTAVEKPFQIRENAFSYLYQIGAFNPESLESLIEGTQHHTYSFRNYSRELLGELLKNEEYRQKILEVSKAMTDAETSYLRSKINL